MKNVKNIIFDFDGVILDSIPVKTEAFRKLLSDFPQEKVDKLIEFHIENGGISRYKKIEYFFTKILNKNITNEDVLKYTKIYSQITKEELAQKKYLIADSLDFIKANHKNYNMHIASGADEHDLKYICNKLDLEKYFLSISGSPKIKSHIISNMIIDNKYSKNETILIGDSINDYYASEDNQIQFYGYNNILLKEKHKYIDSFKEFELFIVLVILKEGWKNERLS